MKLKYILVTILFLKIVITFGQTECKNGVSTNYLMPTNNNLPNSTYNNVDMSSNFLNGFNWVPKNGSFYTNYSPSNIIFNNSPIVMQNIMSTSIPEYSYLVGPGVLEPLIENGWELMLVNLGYYPDNINVIPSGIASNHDFPYIVLYNRYSGIIRVYTNFGPDSDAGQGGNAMTITIGFESDQVEPFSGVFRLYHGYDKALNLPTEVFYASSIVTKPLSGSEWASADFQVAYDPCTCYNLSRLSISIKSHVTSDIELHGRSISTPQNLTNGTGMNPTVSDFISNFELNTNSGVATNGVAIYKTMASAIDDYIGALDKYKTELGVVARHNERVEQNLLLLKAGKIVFAAMINPASVTSVATSVVAATSTDLAIWNTLDSLNEGYTTISDNGDKLFKTDMIIKAVKVIFGDAGKTFIANNLEPQSNPSAPTMPTVTLEEMFYSGTSTVTGSASSVAFFSPGAYGGVYDSQSNSNPSPELNEVYEYPVYNEVLGTFALLRFPRIKISRTIKDEVIDSVKQISHFGGVDCPECGDLIIRTQRYQSWTKEYQISIIEDLKYSFNDVLDIKEYEVKAAYNIVAKPNLLGKTDKQNINLFNDSLKAANIYSTNINVNSMDSILTRGVPYGFYRTHFDPRLYELIPDSTDLDRHSVVFDSVKIKTNYVPIDAFKPFTIGFGLKNEVISYNVQGLSQAQQVSHLVGVSESSVCDYCYEVDLENEYIQKPPIQNPNSIGYDYHFLIELKLMVDIVFNTINSNGVNNSTTLMLTYLIDPSNGQYTIVFLNSDIVPNLASSSSNYINYPENSVFSTTHFNGQQVNGCKLINNTYTCAALNDITIEGDITVANGYHVDFKAGNEINVINESNISPEAVLQIEHIYDYSHPMPQATQGYVTNFCNGLGDNSYLANHKGGKLQAMQDSLQQIEQEEKIKEQMRQDFDFSMFPNPTTNQANIIIDRLLLDGVQISVKDVAGKTIEVLANQQNDNTYIIDVNHLESGIYFVTVSSFGYSKTKRLVITK